jgi:glucokinase
MSHIIFAGVDIGGTKTAVCLSSEPPHILVRSEFPTLPEEGPAQTIEGIVRAIHEMLASKNLDAAQLYSIGVSCGGPLDPVAGVIQCPPNLKTWEQVQIKQILESEFGTKCFLENDANAGALAEYLFGAGRGATNLVFVTLGTGLGAGLILNGKLYRGSSNAAGEIGHVRLSRSGPVGYDKMGSAEGWASGGGMARVAALTIERAVARGNTTVLPQGVDNVTAKQIWEAAQAGDIVAANVIQTCGKKLGEAIAILMDVLNPDCVVVGGLALRMGEAILGPARAVALREALPAALRSCDIVVAELGESIGDVAAVCVAMHGAALPTDSRTVFGELEVPSY